MRKEKKSNRPSALLDNKENEDVFNSIGRGSVTLSTSIVQLYHCYPNETEWQKKCVGVACFVKDNQKKSYFVRIVDHKKKDIVWEQELYKQFKYNTPRPYFHSFEAEDCIAGLNFAENEEAQHFKQVIEERLRNRIESASQENGNSVSSRKFSLPNGTTLSLNGFKKKILKGKKKTALTKDDISIPSDFRHVGHVGWDPDGGFDINNLDSQWAKLFDAVGVTAKQLQDKETSQFIYDFVESHGGIAKATKELEKAKQTQATHPRCAPILPVRRNKAVDSGVGQSTTRRISPPLPPRSKKLPNAPPKRNQKPSRPPLPPKLISSSNKNTSPPPLPPPKRIPSETSEKVVPKSSNSYGNEVEKIPNKHNDATDEIDACNDHSDGRNDLLSAIRKGHQLKTVARVDQENEETATPSFNGMAGALAKALAQRSVHIHVSDDESSYDGSSDEEWD